MQTLDIIGSIAAVITTLSYLPQIWQIWKTKSAADISYGMYGFLFAGISLWLIYGILIDATHMIVANTICLAFIILILGLKLKLKDNRLNDSQHTSDNLLCNECKHKM